MNEIYEWLKASGKKQPETPQIPANSKELIAWMLEELVENAEASRNVNYLLKLFKTVTTNLEKKYYDVFSFELKEPTASLDGYADSIEDMRWFLANMIYFGKLEQLMEEKSKDVLEANWDKFCKTEEEALETIEYYRNNPKEESDKNCTFAISEYKGNKYYVILNDMGKIRKRIGWVEPKKII